MPHCVILLFIISKEKYLCWTKKVVNPSGQKALSREFISFILHSLYVIVMANEKQRGIGGLQIPCCLVILLWIFVVWYYAYSSQSYWYSEILEADYFVKKIISFGFMWCELVAPRAPKWCRTSYYRRQGLCVSLWSLPILINYQDSIIELLP